MNKNSRSSSSSISRRRRRRGDDEDDWRFQICDEGDEKEDRRYDVKLKCIIIKKQ